MLHKDVKKTVKLHLKEQKQKQADNKSQEEVLYLIYWKVNSDVFNDLRCSGSLHRWEHRHDLILGH